MRRSLLIFTALLAVGCSGQAVHKAHAPSPTPVVTTATTTPPPKPKPKPVARPTTTKPRPATSAPRPSAYHYVFPVAGCSVSYGHYHHDYPATDIFTQKGCAFVAPVAGRVDEVSYVDRWDPSVDAGSTRGGRSVSIIGIDGVRYYGSHLLSIGPGIAPGAHVVAGQLLGRIDNSGDARYTATHVHFGISWPTRPGIWWVRRGEVYPWPYLDSWRAGGNLSPVSEVARKHAQMGDVPPCQAEC